MYRAAGSARLGSTRLDLTHIYAFDNVPCLFVLQLKYFASTKGGFQDTSLPFLWTLAWYVADLLPFPKVTKPTLFTPFIYLCLYSSSTAGAAAAVITNPLDLIKLRLQVKYIFSIFVLSSGHMRDNLNGSLLFLN
jgi:hypothetical protein